jgi:hypothetical protein
MGYQIIEIVAIDKLIVSQTSLHVQVSILLWLIDYTKRSLKRDDIELTLIKVEYVGAYPAIGIKYISQTSEDLEDVVTQEWETVLSSVTMKDFIEFIGLNSERIKREVMNF